MILTIDRATAEEWGVFVTGGPHSEHTHDPTMKWQPEMQAWVDRFLHYGAVLKHFCDFEDRTDWFGVEFFSERDYTIFKLYFLPHGYAAA
jgi:hypothetical protein